MAQQQTQPDTVTREELRQMIADRLAAERPTQGYTIEEYGMMIARANRETADRLADYLAPICRGIGREYMCLFVADLVPLLLECMEESENAFWLDNDDRIRQYITPVRMALGYATAVELQVVPGPTIRQCHLHYNRHKQPHSETVNIPPTLLDIEFLGLPPNLGADLILTADRHPLEFGRIIQQIDNKIAQYDPSAHRPDSRSCYKYLAQHTGPIMRLVRCNKWLLAGQKANAGNYAKVVAGLLGWSEEMVPYIARYATATI